MFHRIFLDQPQPGEKNIPWGVGLWGRCRLDRGDLPHRLGALRDSLPLGFEAAGRKPSVGCGPFEVVAPPKSFFFFFFFFCGSL